MAGTFAAALSASDSAAAFPSRAVAGFGFRVVAPIRPAVDPDNREYDHGGRFGTGIDISAATSVAAFLWKLDDFAHCSPLSAPAARPLVTA